MKSIKQTFALLAALIFLGSCATTTIYSDDRQTRWRQMGYDCDHATIKLINTTDAVMTVHIDDEVYQVKPEKKFGLWYHAVQDIPVVPGEHEISGHRETKLLTCVPCVEYTAKL